MDFYESISAYYHQIFPLNIDQVEFVQKEVAPASSILDVGCATGSLSIALSEKTYFVSGFDLDDKMVAMAKAEVVMQKSRAQIQVGNMLDVANAYRANSFDAVACFGNTLVHLVSDDEIETFLSGVKQVLNEGGKFLLQILNYDFILENGITALPLIENETIRFDRYYEKRKDRLLDFNTILTVKASGEQLKNRIQLMPVSKSKLEMLLQNAGFNQLQFYKNFKGDAFDGKGLPLVVVAV